MLIIQRTNITNKLIDFLPPPCFYAFRELAG